MERLARVKITRAQLFASASNLSLIIESLPDFFVEQGAKMVMAPAVGTVSWIARIMGFEYKNCTIFA